MAQRVTINGKRWNLRRVPYLGNKRGDCDSPDTPHKEIRILSGLKGQELLEVLLHELLHAADWTKDESFVENVARDMAKVVARFV